MIPDLKMRGWDLEGLLVERLENWSRSQERPYDS
jgi:hypothetical protein